MFDFVLVQIATCFKGGSANAANEAFDFDMCQKVIFEAGLMNKVSEALIAFEFSDVEVDSL